jgi:RNA polymerase sigma factor (sigma-70 family)
MHAEELNQRLSSSSTVWTLLRQAHEGTAEAAALAQEALFQRYREAVFAYLCGALGDRPVAEELTQEFAVCLVRGDFRHVDPQRGRFRYYLKTVLSHLVSNYRRRGRGQGAPLAPDDSRLADLAAPPEDLDRDFDERCRQQLLARTWQALEQSQPLYHTVLRLRVAHPKMASPELARLIGTEVGRPVTAEAARQAVHRARKLFADLLLEEVAQSLERPNLELVEEELRDLDLLAYCRPALERRSRRGEPPD